MRRKRFKVRGRFMKLGAFLYYYGPALLHYPALIIYNIALRLEGRMTD